jgi:hypothetical protein
MARRIIISAFGGLALSFCLATSSFAAQALSDNQMDKVTAGQGATATLDIGTLTALGPTTATATANNIAITAIQVGGLTPSSSASVTATLTATAN